MKQKSASPDMRPAMRGIALPPLGLGCAALGNLYRAVPDDEAEGALAAAIATGAAYLDTAPHYGQGLSELRIGRFLATHGGDRPVLSSKVGRSLVAAEPVPLRDGFASNRPFRAVFDYRAHAVATQIDDIVERLGTMPEILFVHDIGRLVHREAHEARLAEALDGAFPALLDLRSAGRVRAIGIGVNEIDICLELLDRVPLDFILLAGRYTLLEQGALDALFPRAEALGTRFVIGGPFNSGVLAGGDHYNYAGVPPAVRARVAALEAVARRHGVPLPAAALHFPLAHKLVASVIPGSRSAAEVEANARWLAHPIPAAFWAELRDAGLIDARAPVPV
jgi:D-threo-aldose 1-dehydrogenase